MIEAIVQNGHICRLIDVLRLLMMIVSKEQELILIIKMQMKYVIA